MLIGSLLPAMRAQVVIPDFRVNGDSGTTDQIVPSLGVDSLGNFMIVWQDLRDGIARVYGQLFDSEGEPFGDNFPVWQDSSNAGQYTPRLAMNGKGDFVVVWLERVELHSAVRARLFTSGGIPAGDCIRVNDDTTSRQYFPEAAINASGDFVVVWNDSRDNSQKIYGQRFSPCGVPEGDNFKVFDKSTMPAENYPAVAVDDSGSFIIVADDAYGMHIVMQRFDKNGIPVGDVFIAEDTETSFPGAPSIDMNRKGNFVVSWLEQQADKIYVFTRTYLPGGVPTSSMTPVALIPAGSFPCNPAVSLLDNGNFGIVWDVDYITYSEAWAQLVLSDNTPFEEKFRLPLSPQGNQARPDIALWDNRIYAVWQEDCGDSNSWDIRANVREWADPLDIHISPPHAIPKQICLEQNFPNPFNPSTTIVYRLSQSGPVTLKVHDILGRETETLVSNYQAAGEHTVHFDASNLPGGIYFYTLQAGARRQTHKMLLLK